MTALSAVEDARKLLHSFSLPDRRDVICEFSERLVSDVDKCFNPPKKVRNSGCMLQRKREAHFTN